MDDRRSPDGESHSRCVWRGVARASGADRPDLFVVDGDVGNSTRTEWFAQDHPDRFFNVGIAESNLVSVASGLAASGKTVVAASFAAFLLCNAFDQIRMGVAFPHLNVKLVGSHAGISIGEDGPSQMGIEDVALACALPGFAVVVPSDEHQTRAAVRALLDYDGPAYLRVGRPAVPQIYDENVPFELGKAVQRARWFRRDAHRQRHHGRRGAGRGRAAFGSGR